MAVRPSASSRALLAAVVVALLASAAGIGWLLRPVDVRPLPGVPRAAAASPVPVETPTPTPSTTPTPAAEVCEQPSHPLRPRTITVRGVAREVSVVTPPREADGVPGAPPLTSVGKTVFAWDRDQGISPGDPAGNVLLNAHTWPDGTALGNRLLAGLHRGDRIVVSGAQHSLCYRVTERVEVLASAGLARYYATDGPPQLAIVVCSGRRLGPGVWEKRTVWFAAPSA